MKKILTLILAVSLLGACKRETTSNGIEYKIVRTDESARMVAANDNLQIHLLGVAENSDSVLFDSYKSGKPFFIPAGEPTLKDLFAVMRKGDSAVFSVIADTLYNNFGETLPQHLKHGERIHFSATLVDIFNPQEMQQRIEDENKQFLTKDSIELMDYLKNNTTLKSTASGLKYEVVRPGKGKLAKKGDKVTVKYRGSLLNGNVFDESKPGNPEFAFTIGAGQVIAGWDEAFQLMHEGDALKIVIPWKLAYGPRGMGPIPPYATLVFDVELLKIN